MSCVQIETNTLYDMTGPMFTISIKGWLLKKTFD